MISPHFTHKSVFKASATTTTRDPVIIRAGSTENSHPDRFGFGDTSAVTHLLYLIPVLGQKAVALQRVAIVRDKCNNQRHHQMFLFWRSEALRLACLADSLRVWHISLLDASCKELREL